MREAKSLRKHPGGAFRGRVGALIAVAFVLSTFAAVAPAHAAPAGTPPAGGFRARGPWIVDAAGRVNLAHGVNVVYKRPPYVPSPAEFGPPDVAALVGYGFGVVRLGIIWKGVEPSRGVFDEAYLDRIEEIVDLLWAAGIAVIVDSHQDVWNERYNGEGAPDWATLDDGIPFQPQPLWGLGYFQAATGRAFDSFYTNREGIRDEYARMWAHVAARFADHPGVLGYELLNEPWPGSLWWLLIFDDGALLAPLYRELLGAIRAVDAHHMVLFEPNIVSFSGLPSTVGPLGDTNVLYSHHVYCPLGTAGLGNPEWICSPWDAEIWAARRTERDRMGTPWLLTEFGATDDAAELARMTRLADEQLSGWTYWDWKPFDDPTGTHDQSLVGPDLAPKAKLPVLARTHAVAVAGTPEAQSFDPATGAYALRYRPDPAATLPTEIAVPRDVHYTAGYRIRVTGGEARRARRGRQVLVTASPGATVVTLEIRRR